MYGRDGAVTGVYFCLGRQRHQTSNRALECLRVAGGEIRATHTALRKDGITRKEYAILVMVADRSRRMAGGMQNGKAQGGRADLISVR